MGSKVYGLNLGVQLFSHTSCDPYGPMAVNNFYKAKNLTDLYIFLYVCLEFGAVWLTATEGCSTKEVISSLISLECNYNCKIRVLSVDAGTNLLEKNVKIVGDFDRKEPKMEIGNLEEKTGIQVINNLRDSHSRVLAENRIKLAKKILRQFFKIKRNSKGPVLTRTELQLSLSMAAIY